MRKLRSLWCSHKKYCTTITPLRSYTPLSGYPNSRASYDLDRTYYTSTPNTYRQELATLQRQVNGLTLTLQTPHTPNTYQAHPPHTTPSDRNIAHSPSNNGRDYPRSEPPGHPTDEPVGPITALPAIKRDDPYETARVTEANVEPDKETDNFVDEEETTSEETRNVKDYEDLEYPQKEESEHEPETKIKQDAGKPMEVEQTLEYDTQNYPYNQNYEQTQETVDPQYQNQYDQNYEQPYTEQQQYENFEQYPQQFTDPNTQYDPAYENYQTDSNYQGDQNYDVSQYGQEYQIDQNAENYNKSHNENHDLQKQDDPNTETIQKEKGFEQNGSSRAQIDNNPSQS
ncbi:unnamed protein product [Arctia plantaginis]|uniref:Uncharacterized protein n=1 Tax=Arctia plantaginis TaxID=874455 RepID=A0A8S1AH64_ARCPL|nr:unnamed protein product [Arctia plantaginis]